MKFRQTITFTFEYEVDLSHYPPGSSEKQMLQIDKNATEYDVGLTMDNPDGKLEVTVERLFQNPVFLPLTVQNNPPARGS